ncbi:RHS repeat-associated core domain-containing protein [Pseudomonas maumuensis]|uniref:RHS repeat-associated core domain-containing protein n=1 Tax=Pseudomonas maumuensis TaxID=2842354 RepID=A0ABX8NPD9_9PSED|nr:RHS repeat-associated core domain-containing protein [Pseudomonas maumuensis]QXH57905.1 RHS repeat-associated core domain-containing protein [Pseudomonas maumuensis]
MTAQCQIELLAVDRADSIMAGQPAAMQPAYSAYGYCANAGKAVALAFNGEYWDAGVDGYLLGKGYRLYSPSLLRFLSADAMSPFGKGGINAYTYCNGDPINNVDPSGRLGLPPKLAHAVNSKMQRKVFDAGALTPFRNLGMAEDVDPYGLKREFKRGNVGAVVEQVGIGNFDSLIGAYSYQARNVLVAVTKNAFNLVVSGNAAVESGGQFSFTWQGPHGIAAVDAKVLSWLAAGQKYEPGQAPKLPELAGNAVNAKNAGKKVQNILARRIESLRQGEIIAADDWYASNFNQTLNPTSS